MRNSVTRDLGATLADKQYRAKDADDVWRWFAALDAKWVNPDGRARARRFVYRGQDNAAWPITSTLFRMWSQLRIANTRQPIEDQLRALESAIMIVGERRGLTHLDGSRLSYMAQLAHLQHYGAPTRLIDVTFDLHVALWFACAPSDADGRVVALCVDADGKLPRLLAEVSVRGPHLRRADADRYNCPWGVEPKQWRQAWMCWRPALSDRRMFAQQGAFLVGGFPDGARLHTSSVRLDWHSGKPRTWGQKGKRAVYPVLSLVIPASAKAAVRDRLSKLHGINDARLFPDFPGLANYVRPNAQGELAEEIALLVQREQERQRAAVRSAGQVDGVDPGPPGTLRVGRKRVKKASAATAPTSAPSLPGSASVKRPAVASRRRRSA